MSASSPIPPRAAVAGYRLFPGDEKREGRWYVLESEPERRYFVGGPYSSREEAEAAIERWAQELHELYLAVEADARKHGYTVQWGPR